MEARKITVIPTREQRSYVVTTGAENLKELKEALDDAGISYEGMSFIEGLTKTELKSDESILPKDVEYKGRNTNELAIMLTNTEKKISSGFDRKELYRLISEKGLKDEIKKVCGRNYTHVPTEELAKFMQAQSIPAKDPEEEVAEKPAEKNVSSLEARVEQLEITLSKLTRTLNQDGFLDDDEMDEICGNDVEEEPKKEKGVYSSEELDEIMRGLR